MRVVGHFLNFIMEQNPLKVIQVLSHHGHHFNVPTLNKAFNGIFNVSIGEFMKFSIEFMKILT